MTFFHFQYGMVVYSTEAENSFFMNTFLTTDEIVASVRNTSYIGGRSNTASGIRAMTDEQFTVENGDRSRFKNVGKLKGEFIIVVITMWPSEKPSPKKNSDITVIRTSDSFKLVKFIQNFKHDVRVFNQ